MKKFLLILLVISINSYSQDNFMVQLAVEHTHRPEHKTLEKIEQKQATIIIPTTAIGKFTAELNIRQDQMYKRLYEVYSVVSELQIYLKVLTSSNELLEELEKLYEISSENPEAAAIAAYTEFEVSKKSFKILADLFKATLESKLNLMTNLDRMELMGRCLDALNKLKLWVRYCYRAIKHNTQTQFITQFVNGELDVELSTDFIYESLDLEAFYEEFLPYELRDF